MGDRNNPIKFGPEWLRNLSGENNVRIHDGSDSSGSPAAANSPTTSGAAAAASGGNTVMASSQQPITNATATNNNNLTKVQLARLRYGREEMLALYDRTTDAPPEIKMIDVLYQTRGKPPIALHNTFEDDLRENLRSGTAIGGHPTDRFGAGRAAMGRAVSADRGRSRVPFVRQPAGGRTTTWHSGNPKMPGFNTGPDEESSNIRPWMNTNGASLASRNNGEQADWTSSKPFRNKRHGHATNWRQSREEGEEWRSGDPHQRSRANQQDKWGERDWGERAPEKPQWNRRTWGGDGQNEENLPEWAVENAEACGGTFDSSGAFHGYSNDDTNLPRSQDISYPLARSHTHGSFARSKTAEEGSEEWWASEKAKKLSPKRFDADVKFKKMNMPEDNSETGSDPKASTSKEQPNNEPVFSTESKAFDALLRADMNLEETPDETGNFQSVMIPPSNSLRQKHQNIVPVSPDVFRDSRDQRMLYLLNPQNTMENDIRNINAADAKMVEQFFEMSFNEKDPLTKQQKTISGPPDRGNPNIAAVAPMASNMPQLPNSGMQLRLSSPIFPNQGLINPPQNIQGLPIGIQLPIGALPPLMPGMPPMGMPGGLPQSQLQPGGNTASNQGPSLQEQLHNLQQSSGIPTSMQGGLPGNSGMQSQGLQGPMPPSMQTVGITNSALNASLGLPIGPVNNAIGIPLTNIPHPVLQNPGMNSNIGGPGGLSGVPMQGGNPGMSGFPGNVGNNSLFLRSNANSSSISGDIPLPNQNNIFPIHGLQHSGSGAFGSSLYSNIMPRTTPPPQNSQSLSEQWYYQDPEKNIQGPFSSKDMYNWYRAGFFTPSLMVRRACDSHMRPLGSYGPVVPFTQMDILPFPMAGGFDRSPGAHEPMINPQQTLGLEPVDSLWGQSAPSADMMWIQPPMNPRNDQRVNNLPMFFWDQKPSAITSNALLPEEITKEMKTEDQILAQLRATQNISTQQNISFMSDPPASVSPDKSEEAFSTSVPKATPDMEELQKLIQKDTLAPVPDNTTVPDNKVQVMQLLAEKPKQQVPEPREPKEPKESKESKEPKEPKEPKSLANKVTNDAKPAEQKKSNKHASEKTTKNKDNSNAKNKNKKKEEKKEEVECKPKEEVTKVERSEESSSIKNKREEKVNKKELEKEKKEWLKEGFTIVKGSEKSNTKDNKKKMEEFKMAEDAEKKRKEEERVAAEDEKKKKQAETMKKQQEVQQQQQHRQAAESVAKKAPWSAVTSQAMMSTNNDGMSLTEIQKLEKEKKLEQMKEQQQMMQLIAQQQAAALAREQVTEMQAGLGWAKKKGNNMSAASQTLAEIQAETRKQAAAAAAAIASLPPHEEIMAVVNQVPWNSSPNGGFWDTPANQKGEKGQDSAKSAGAEQKGKKKSTVNTAVKKRAVTTPAAEFEAWCTTVLTTWSSKIDVTTFVGFLKDIESPYEVKDYVKYYLGESKDTNDFARQFLEKRSKLLRVGMVTPSDDLCSPAIAINPRTASGSDYQEVKGKGKKTKKNKMLKVDARILGFSVTAAEDRINVGDIDTV